MLEDDKWRWIIHLPDGLRGSFISGLDAWPDGTFPTYPGELSMREIAQLPTQEQIEYITLICGWIPVDPYEPRTEYPKMEELQ